MSLQDAINEVMSPDDNNFQQRRHAFDVHESLIEASDKDKAKLALALLESIGKPAHRTAGAKLDCAKNDLEAAIPNLCEYKGI